jgi:UDP:flavonoid glycosyltransferase YjiC (YdhE family)
MKIVVAVHGTRGDVEPCLAVAIELRRRGHEVSMAVPPNLIDFATTSGFANVKAYGPDSQQQIESEFFLRGWQLCNPFILLREARKYLIQGWQEMGELLHYLSQDADLILTGTTYQEVAANVAEARGVALVALHFFPCRLNTATVPLPIPIQLLRPFWVLVEWLHWRLIRPAEDRQRLSLGLPQARTRAVGRIVNSGSLEIQCYDKLFFPELAGDWGFSRPIVGSMSIEQAFDHDQELMDWIAAGQAPLYFGFGSMPVHAPKRTLNLIADVCAELGLRALINTPQPLPDSLRESDSFKLVRMVNLRLVLPCCRVVVHHGGAGTTAAGVRAGVPTLVLWVGAEQPLWGRAVQRLGIGTSGRLSTITHESLRAMLIKAMKPKVVARARLIAGQMTRPSESATAVADLVEAKARNHKRR